MNEEQRLREYWDERFAKGTVMEGARPVKARVAREPRAVFSLRLSASELATISNAARARGVNLSDFVRLAALTVAQEQRPVVAGEQASLVENALTDLQALSADLSKLADMYQVTPKAPRARVADGKPEVAYRVTRQRRGKRDQP